MSKHGVPVVPFSGEVHKSPSNMNGTNNIDSILVAKAGEFQAIVNNINVSLTTLKEWVLLGLFDDSTKKAQLRLEVE